MDWPVIGADPERDAPPLSPWTSPTTALWIDGPFASRPAYCVPMKLGLSRLMLEAVVDLLTWLIVGLIAGLLAKAAVGGVGYGLLGDMLVGMVGAVFGGWIFSTLRIASPMGGLPGTILVAFIGAVVLLLLLRMLRPGRRLA